MPPKTDDVGSRKMAHLGRADAKPVIPRSIRGLRARDQRARGLEVILVISIKERIDLADRKIDHGERIGLREEVDLAHARRERLAEGVADRERPEAEDRMGAAPRR